MSKTHNHSEQFDGKKHSVCGRGKSYMIVTSDVFEGIESEYRCKFCERDWFPNGQTKEHFEQAKEAMIKKYLDLRNAANEKFAKENPQYTVCI